jgi:signal transduction histidine kinase
MLRSEIEMVLSLQEAGVADVLADESWEVVVPLIGPTHLLGILCLGAKTAREAYSAGDLQVLGRVGAEATFALENARLYEELRRSQQLIDRAARLSALGTLAAGIAHEVRNPLVSIQTFFQLAPERLHDDEFMTSFLKLAEEEVDRIRNLISELLSFARSSEATMQNVTVQDVIGRIVVLMTPQAREKRISLIVDSLPIDPIVIQGDPDQLVQVLMNLVLNAIQATPENGYVRIDLKSVENEDELFCELVVSDTGPGISADVRESIFNPFFTTKESGTGLGLAMAYQIVSDYGGTIVVDVGAAEGASFRVRLPVTAEGRETLAPAVGAA